jgi:hypothetical protein
MTVNEASAHLGVSQPLVLRWITDGTLAADTGTEQPVISCAAVTQLQTARIAVSRSALADVRNAHTDPAASRRTAFSRAWAITHLTERDLETS